MFLIVVYMSQGYASLAASREGIGTPPKEEFINLRLDQSLQIPKEVVYAVVTMYRIGRDKGGTTLMCRACTHTERIQDFKRSIGNPRTLAAQSMLKHFHAEHSRETHVRAMAMVIERQHAPR
jgi:hypothetical protein